MSDVWWTSWEAVVRVALLSATGYAGLLVALRVSGKRSTAKMNIFDWVVTVALGSMLATFSLSPSIPLAAGLTAVVTLVALQFVVSWLHVRWPGFQELVTGSPTLLYFDGEYLDDHLRAERVSREDVRSKARTAGHASMDDVYAVVLEPDAELSVLGREADRSSVSLLDDTGMPGGEARSSRS